MRLMSLCVCLLLSPLTLVSWWLSLVASPELPSPYHAETLSCPPECSEFSALYFDPSAEKGDTFIIYNYYLLYISIYLCHANAVLTYIETNLESAQQAAATTTTTIIVCNTLMLILLLPLNNEPAAIFFSANRWVCRYWYTYVKQQD